MNTMKAKLVRESINNILVGKSHDEVLYAFRHKIKDAENLNLISS